MNKKVLIFILLLISATVFFAWTKLNQEAPPLNQEQKKKALEQTLGRSIKQEKVILQGENIYKGKFLSLSYPAYARLDDRKDPLITKNQNLLEYLILNSDEPRFRFMVMVERGDTAVLDELSGVRVRRQSRLYQEMPITVDGKEGALFVKTSDGVERSSFFLINGRSYSFVITGVDVGELEKIYGKIMESLLLPK